MRLTLLYEYLDLVPNCYGGKPGQYCDPKGKAKVVGSGDMSHLVGGTAKKKKKKKKKK